MTACMDAKVHEEFFFLRYLQERHLLRSSRTQSMYLLVPTKRCSFSVTLVWSPFMSILHGSAHGD